MKKLDLFWLVDATGSMSSAIDSVKHSISQTWEYLSYDYDLGQGIGYYRDMEFDESGFGIEQPITTSPNLLQTGADKILPIGGGDGPESQVYALTQIAVESSRSVGWRPDATRVVIWMGDMYGHLNQKVNGLTYTTRGAVNLLNQREISVYAFSMNPINKLNSSEGGKYVAASQITYPTGGQVFEHVDQENAIQYIIQIILANGYRMTNTKKSLKKVSDLLATT